MSSITRKVATATATATPVNVDKAVTTACHAIPFLAVARSNERCLVWDIRNTLTESNLQIDKLASYVKAWIAMQDKTAPQDAYVLRFCHELLKVVYTGKDATCKPSDTKQARLEVCSQGRVKAWLYTIHRANGILQVVDNKPVARPEEKVVKACKAKKVTVSEDELAAFRAWKAAQEKLAK